MAVNAQEILKGVNSKDLKAWNKVYALYYSALCTYAKNIVKDVDTAEDIVQETLIKVWNSERQFSDIRDFSWYLYKAVFNNSLFYLRTQNTRPHISLEIADMEIPEEQFALTVREELIRQLYVYIEDLPEERKKVILLSLKGYSGNEIAKTLGITIHTVKTQKSRALRYLRVKLKDSVLLFLI